MGRRLEGGSSAFSAGRFSRGSLPSLGMFNARSVSSRSGSLWLVGWLVSSAGDGDGAIFRGRSVSEGWEIGNTRRHETNAEVPAVVKGGRTALGRAASTGKMATELRGALGFVGALRAKQVRWDMRPVNRQPDVSGSRSQRLFTVLPPSPNCEEPIKFWSPDLRARSLGCLQR